MEVLSQLLVISIQNGIIYAYSKNELKLYRLKHREELGVKIGMFITFERTDGFVMDVTTIIEKRTPLTSRIEIEETENGPILVLRTWLIFSKNPSLRSHKMITGFSDWYGYVRIVYKSLIRSRNAVFVMGISVDDLDYDQKTGASLFRQHTKKIGRRFDLSILKTIEDREIELKSTNVLESNEDEDVARRELELI
ncbi:unnamed protein product [Caenorhabditis angaria]|uniref:RSD-2 N-terminal domain-containing protein n=1 Tax=Caenorhabditis angaria TaxID=860376 RepID=A0A9P1N912_9PELO|nr:unnamed protein product [Caenorhabditis angaria]